MDDTISRQAAIDVVRDVMLDFIEYEDEIEVPMADTDKQLLSIKKAISKKIKALPSAQPEIKPIEYRDCVNAMLRMWMDNVVTDGEYNRIMNKLNAHWGMKNG